MNKFYIFLIFVCGVFVTTTYNLSSPWSSLTVKKNYAAKACEPIRMDKFVRSPWNAYSNLSFLCLFLYIVWIKPKYHIFCTLMNNLLFLFITSFLYHASITDEMNHYDAIAMYNMILWPAVMHIYLLNFCEIFCYLLYSAIFIYLWYIKFHLKYEYVIFCMLGIDFITLLALFYSRKSVGNIVEGGKYVMCVFLGFLFPLLVILNIVDCKDKYLQPFITFPFHPLIALGLYFSYYYYSGFLSTDPKPMNNIILPQDSGDKTKASESRKVIEISK